MAAFTFACGVACYCRGGMACQYFNTETEGRSSHTAYLQHISRDFPVTEYNCLRAKINNASDSCESSPLPPAMVNGLMCVRGSEVIHLSDFRQDVNYARKHKLQDRPLDNS
eukprot:4113569-Amphidinium_carterae.1